MAQLRVISTVIAFCLLFLVMITRAQPGTSASKSPLRRFCFPLRKSTGAGSFLVGGAETNATVPELACDPQFDIPRKTTSVSMQRHAVHSWLAPATVRSRAFASSCAATVSVAACVEQVPPLLHLGKVPCRQRQKTASPQEPKRSRSVARHHDHGGVVEGAGGNQGTVGGACAITRIANKAPGGEAGERQWSTRRPRSPRER